jgi:hypothetical protein
MPMTLACVPVDNTDTGNKFDAVSVEKSRFVL